MALEHAQIFDSLRPNVLARLIEVRGSIEDAYAKIPEATIREHFELVLGKVHLFLATGDITAYGSFVSRYLAVRVGEGFSHENILHTAVAIGDVVVQVARESLPESTQRERFIQAIMRLNFLHARMLVELMATELAERVAQRDALLGRTA